MGEGGRERRREGREGERGGRKTKTICMMI